MRSENIRDTLAILVIAVAFLHFFAETWATFFFFLGSCVLFVSGFFYTYTTRKRKGAKVDEADIPSRKAF